MKLTKKLEGEINQVYDTYWKALFIADIDAYTSVLDQNFKLIGTTETEYFFNRIEAIQFLKDTTDQVVGNIELRNRNINIELLGSLVLITEQSDTYVKIEGAWSFYGKVRVSSLLEKKKQVWKFSQMHLSFPDSKAVEGQTIGLDKISKENLELKDAIKRRTVELENKNKELELETSLERVRAVAMGMHQPADLIKICKAIYDELQALGFSELRNTLIDIFEDQEKYFTDYDYSAFTGGTSSKIPYSGNPVIEKYIKNIRKSGEAFSEITVKGAQLEEWKQFRSDNGEIEDSRLNDIKALYYYKYSIGPGSIGISTYSRISKEQLNILHRFRNVFNLSYQRYADIAKAEAQARESRIEAALERVRSKTMAMHNSNDVGETVATLFEEFEKLGIHTNRCGILIISNEIMQAEVWTAKSNHSGKANLIIGQLDLTMHPLLEGFYHAWKNKESVFNYTMIGDDLKLYYQAINNTKFYPTQFDQDAFPSKEFHTDFYFNEGSIFAFTTEPINEEAASIFKRFANVFGQTYRRYLDLQKAEAQTREAQIETALEKVRSRTMAMQNSNELQETAVVLFNEFKKLGTDDMLQVTIGIYNEEERVIDFRATNWAGGGEQENRSFEVDMDEPTVAKPSIAAWKAGKKSAVFDLTGDALQGWLNYRNKISGITINPNDTGGRRVISAAYFSKGHLTISTPIPLADQTFKTLERFAAVFDGTYTRFLDLQKSEAQTKEAEIELALERIRARALAMHRSDEFTDVAKVMREQMGYLGQPELETSAVHLYEEDDNNIFSWRAFRLSSDLKGDINFGFFKIPKNSCAIAREFIQNFKSKAFDYTIEVSGAKQTEWYKILFKVAPEVQESMEKSGTTKEKRYYHFSKFTGGALLMVSSQEPAIDVIELQNRSAKVFDLAYRRFKDLQNAEAQARESQIEAALERVRGKAMAMHSTKDLSVAANTVFTELKLLGVESFRSGVGLLSKHHKRATMYATTSKQGKELLDLVGEVEIVGHVSFEKQYEAWLNQEMYVSVLEGAELYKYYQILFQNFKAAESTRIEGHEKEYGYYLPFSEGLMYSWSTKPYSDDEIRMLNRFKIIIDLTFRRYIELQRLEANALEALRSASLDRVRAEIASMRNKADLDKITPLIWKELTVLNIPFVRCGVFILDEIEEQIHTFLSTPDGKAIAAFHLPYFFTPLKDSIDFWRAKKIYQTHWGMDAYAAFADAIANQESSMNKEQYLSSVPKEGIYLHLLPFMQGMLYVGNTAALSEDMLQLIQSVADAFSNAYARYEDFVKLEDAKKQIENTLADLQAAQKQLIQSEKMASLGELTAGIAHEIQNPLNFVNNFSEVSTELVDEMNQEIDNGNLTEAKEIANDLKQNLEKINHHGKRAGDIVKGMLQHSRSSSGEKEHTDINVLADEYLRLAFHGLRAKDKSFNATLVTEYDASIGNINIIRQDIGRVILNLISNAFYAVDEKKKQQQEGYEPTVTVATKKRMIAGIEMVTISVSDNGNGIPQKVLDKIFQPFFTTKPTGQGTGLGLSLSYDIVKAHGGELKVETKEGVGTCFTIQLKVIDTK